MLWRSATLGQAVIGPRTAFLADAGPSPAFKRTFGAVADWLIGTRAVSAISADLVAGGGLLIG